MHVDPASAVKKKKRRDHAKFVGGFALSGLLASGRASMLPRGTLPLGLCILAVDPTFIAWHFSKIKTEFYSISFFIFEIHRL